MYRHQQHMATQNKYLNIFFFLQFRLDQIISPSTEVAKNMQSIPINTSLVIAYAQLKNIKLVGYKNK